MKTLLALLLLIPSLSWGEKRICRYDDSGSDGLGWYNTSINPDFLKWNDKNKKVFKKQERFWEKCVVKKSGKVLGDFYELKFSTQQKISSPCWDDARDKYKTKGNKPFKYILLETGNLTNNYCGNCENFEFIDKCKEVDIGKIIDK